MFTPKLKQEMLAGARLPRPACASYESVSCQVGDECVGLHELEKRHILSMLEQCNQTRTQAAKLLEISVRTLRNKLHEYGATAAAGETEPEEAATTPMVGEKSD